MMRSIAYFLCYFLLLSSLVATLDCNSEADVACQQTQQENQEYTTNLRNKGDLPVKDCENLKNLKTLEYADGVHKDADQKEIAGLSKLGIVNKSSSASISSETREACSPGSVQVSWTRTYKNNAIGENTYLYSRTGSTIWSWIAPSSYKVTVGSFCLLTGPYTIVMKDGYGDGWSEGSNLVLSVGSSSVTIRMDSGIERHSPLFVSSTGISTSCPSDLTKVSFVRTCTSDAVQESTYLYSGSDTSKFPILSLDGSSSYNNQVINGYLCLSAGSYTMVMKDSAGNGWPSGSNLVMSVSSSSMTLQVESGIHDKYSPLSVSSTGISICSSDLIEASFVRTHKSNAIQESVSLYSGSGSSLLSLDGSSSYSYKVIGGLLCLSTGSYMIAMGDSNGDGWSLGSKFVMSVASSSVTFQMETGLMEKYSPISISSSGINTSCSSDLIEVSFVRTFKGYAYQESVSLYSGSGSSLLSLSSPYDFKVISGSLCLSAGSYTIAMYDTIGNGWSTGSNLVMSVASSSVTLRIESSIIESYSPLSISSSRISTSCSSDLIEVSFVRTYKLYTNQESVSLYSGSGTSGSSLLNLYGSEYNNKVISGSLCLSAGSYTIAMKDINGDGWPSGSNLVMSVASSSVTLQMETGFVEKHSPLFVSSTGISTSCSSGLIKVSWTRTYKSNADQENVSLYSGSESSLWNLVGSSSHDNQVISGYLCLSAGSYTIVMGDGDRDGWSEGSTLVMSVSSSSVTLRMDSGIGKYSPLFVSSSRISTSCSSDLIEVSFVRTYKSNADQESVSLYSESGSSLLSLVGSSSYNNQVMNYYLCLSAGSYTIALKDINGDGWASGSNLVMSVAPSSVTLQMESGFVEKHSPLSISSSRITTSCSSDLIEVSFVRTYKSNADQESVSLHVGSGSSLWSLAGSSSYNNQVISGSLCLSAGSYTMMMKDSAGDGWTSGSNLVMSVASSSMTIRVESGTSTNYSFSISSTGITPSGSSGLIIILILIGVGVVLLVCGIVLLMKRSKTRLPKKSKKDVEKTIESNEGI